MTEEINELDNRILDDIEGPVPEDGITFSEYDNIEEGCLYTSSDDFKDVVRVYRINAWAMIGDIPNISYKEGFFRVHDNWFYYSDSGAMSSHLLENEFKNKYRYVLNVK